jgi:hypothetical protein
MSTRLGIELSPLACRIVELDGDVPGTRVRSFAVLPASGTETQERLTALAGREAAVVVWDVRCDHRQVIVSSGRYEAMRAEAIAAAREAGVHTDGMAADIAPAASPSTHTGRQAVLLTLASADDLASALRPLQEAGLRIHSAVTAPNALASLARTRRSLAAPESIELYVALEETATAAALVRDGALLAACTLPWGFLADLGSRQPRGREALALKLGDEVSAFLSNIGAAPSAIEQLLICGGLPDLRSMTVPLMERLDLEVETLDSLFGIDVARLPASAEDFRDRAAELRVAWAPAADWLAPINLTRPRHRRVTKTLVARAAIAAGVAVGVGLGWRIEQSDWWAAKQVAPQRPATAAPQPAPPAPRGPARVTAPVPATLPVPAAPAPRVPPPRSVAVEAPPVNEPPPPRVDAAPPTVAVARPAPIVASAAPAGVPEPPARAEPPAPRRVERYTPRESPPIPFDAVLGTILFSADRKLAIIDGRIVGIGEEVRGARIVDITSAAVLLRDSQGRTRILTLGANGR